MTVEQIPAAEVYDVSLGITPGVIAAAHLRVRQIQEKNGSSFFADIYESQADLLGLQEYYINGGGNFFIARTPDGQLKGFVGLRNDGDGKAKLKRMAVLPEYEGQGTGTALVNEVIDWARTNGFSKISLRTRERENAREFIYLKAGFRDVGRIPDPPNPDDYAMELDLV